MDIVEQVKRRMMAGRTNTNVKASGSSGRDRSRSPRGSLASP